MATEKIVVSPEEKELRKELGLPVTKPLRYMEGNYATEYREIPVTSFRIVDQYQPSGSYSLVVTLLTGEEIRVFAPYFAQMQKPSFVEDMKKEQEE